MGLYSGGRIIGRIFVLFICFYRFFVLFFWGGVGGEWGAYYRNFTVCDGRNVMVVFNPGE